ncbi:REP-associated tyrosine transposase [Pseudomonas wadenswilerensis]
MSDRLRRGRFSESGRLYLLTSILQNREPLFRDLKLARLIVGQFRLAQEEGHASSLAWVVMPDHIHWLVDLHQGSLGALMRRFKSRSAHGINRLLQRQGQCWQEGFHDRALRRDEDVREVARYIITNPIRAGLVTRARDYPHWDAVWL